MNLIRLSSSYIHFDDFVMVSKELFTSRVLQLLVKKVIRMNVLK